MSKTISLNPIRIYNFMFQLPPNLRKYIVEQNYDKYTPIDQACWRFIMRQLRSFLGHHAHECYLEGLEKTGISVDKIPRISEISEKLEKFGWRALAVSGFIPPAAFMELQSLGVLPIASDMRSLEHLTYTPAPDIVHEAAGHAPILIHPEFAEYLKAYAQVARKAIISREDLNLYEAIRELSDLKENPQSSQAQIDQAQKHLDQVSKNMSHLSEAGELSRMNWWTAEYGLIGDIKNPKIYGAGLLSSVGESKWCLSEKVRKIPLSVDCIKQTYDITEPQPQLFVTPNFSYLSKVLEEMANQMAFRCGDQQGLDKAIKAKTVNTAQLNSGTQISGEFASYLIDSQGKISYLRTSGPTQICYDDREILGHSKQYHAQGFGTVVGDLKGTSKCLSLYSLDELSSLGIVEGKRISLKYKSGIVVDGTLRLVLRRNNKNILFSLDDCRVLSGSNEILFDPSWGTYDMAVGNSVTSVFSGPSDRSSYGELEDFPAKTVPTIRYADQEKQLHHLYQKVRSLREESQNSVDLEKTLSSTFVETQKDFPKDWLLALEILEICHLKLPQSDLKMKAIRALEKFMDQGPELKGLIQDGIALSTHR